MDRARQGGEMTDVPLRLLPSRGRSGWRVFRWRGRGEGFRWNSPARVRGPYARDLDGAGRAGARAWRAVFRSPKLDAARGAPVPARAPWRYPKLRNAYRWR